MCNRTARQLRRKNLTQSVVYYLSRVIDNSKSREEFKIKYVTKTQMESDSDMQKTLINNYSV